MILIQAVLLLLFLIKSTRTRIWFKERVHCFSMQVVMNKCFLLNSEKQFGANPFCRFRDKRTFNSEKWRHRAEGSS